MTIQITIIGLGQIGASIGLALAEYKNLVRIGHDKNTDTAKAAQKMGAVNKIKRNLPNSVKEADIIILSLPFSEIRETIGYIKADLKEDVVILDTAPSKVATSAWMQENLPAGRSYIGLAPVINPFYLDEEARGVETAHADLFHKGITMISTSPSASGEVIQLAADLTQLFGSQPLFADAAEVDGVMTSAYLLPQLVAVALVDATIGAPGWGDARKFAGRAYVETTEASQIEEGVASLSGAALANGENMIRVLDGMIESLQSIKKSIADDDVDTLNEILSHAEEGREDWLVDRRAAEWRLRGDRGDAVALGGISERFFGFKQRKSLK